jgi:hypothetical protein
MACIDLRYARHLRENERAYSEHSDGGAPRRLLISDDDGNKIALFQDPAPALIGR